MLKKLAKRQAGAKVRAGTVRPGKSRIRARFPGEHFALIEKGYSIVKIESVGESLGVGSDRVVKLLRIAPATLARRRKSGTLTAEESDRLFRLECVFQKALELFEGDASLARQWLESPAGALQGLRPIDLLINSAGVREVEHLINRLDHGVFT